MDQPTKQDQPTQKPAEASSQPVIYNHMEKASFVCLMGNIVFNTPEQRALARAKKGLKQQSEKELP